MMTSHSTVSRIRSRILPLAFALAAAVTCLVSAPSEAHAENLIKRPGAHNRYKFELEPHLGFWWGWGNRDDLDFGPGIRASIPFMHNGPIDTLNNNIGISFGLDTYFPNGDLVIISSPVAFQWNFYFTDVISVLGEAGLQQGFDLCIGTVGFKQEIAAGDVGSGGREAELGGDLAQLGHGQSDAGVDRAEEGDQRHPVLTKLSSTRFRPACSKSISSLLPSMAAMVP